MQNSPAYFGLIGHPLGHSFSAAYFHKKFEAEGLLDHVYLNFDLDDLPSGISRLKSDGNCRGLNVTIPYKQEIIAFLDAVSPQAAAIGAVNTIQVDSHGRWKGYNTDYIGFYESLMHFAPDLQKKKYPALIIGNGGASQAVQYALHSHQWPYFLLCRNPERVKSREFAPLEVFSYQEFFSDMISECSLLVNTTKLGMFPEVDSLPAIPYEKVNSGHFVFDLVYNPARTAFMRRCASAGATVCNGLEMLHLQAEAAWKIWTMAE